MGIKYKKPVTAGQRGMSVSTFEELTRKESEKSLTVKLRRKMGHNVYGRITAQHRGGGHKRKYRIIDFKRDKDNIPARVASIEYDPNRSAHIALLHYVDGEKRYIIAPEGLKVGDTIISGNTAPIKIGNALPLRQIPEGTELHCLELQPGEGAQLARGAGSYCQLIAKEKNYAHVKLPSGEIRMIHEACKATIGHVGNADHENVDLGKAGRSRWLARRPRTRGVAMNPVDHPLGGGEGRTSGGRHPCSPWGLLTKGYKTRKPRKPSDRFIIKRRAKKKKGK